MYMSQGRAVPVYRKNISLLTDIKILFRSLSQKRRLQLGLLVVFMLVGALAEMAALGAIVPFLALLSDPSIIDKYPLLQSLFSMLGSDNGQDGQLYASVLFAFLAVLSAVVRIFISWFSYRFIFALGADIGSDIYRRTLYQPYSFHVRHNTSEVIAGLEKVNYVVNGVITPLIQGMVSAIISFSIVVALINIDFQVSVIAISCFSILYLLTSKSTQSKFRANGKVYNENYSKRIQAIQEGLGGIRELIIDGTQPIFVERFKNYDQLQRRAQASNGFVSAIPRFYIEAFGMVIFATLAIWMQEGPGDFVTIVPVLGALALGAQKLLPQFQQLFFCWASLSGSQAALGDVLELLGQPLPEENIRLPNDEKLHLGEKISLRAISFKYADDSPDVLREISLSIHKGSRVGLIGETGSGKSTLVDLIMGLLDPTSGFIEIDRQRLDQSNIRMWQANIAHVSQDIFLSDGSIAENIAFGIAPDRINYQRLNVAAQRAHLNTFIENLPQQYQTMVGERGVRLSGGQRQRIGLARALYKQAEVLVLDEATSALDVETEKSVMRSIEELGPEITVIIIAHRISTLRNCHFIYEVMRNGEIIHRDIKDII